MGELHQQREGAEQDDLQTREAPSAERESPALAEAKALIATTAAHPNGLARIIREHPESKAEIMALVHRTMGNGFAMELVEALKREVLGGQGPKPGSKNDPFVNDDGGGEAKAMSQSPSKDVTRLATAEALKDDPLNRSNQSARDRSLTAAMMDFETSSNNQHEVNPNAPPIEAPKTDPAKSQEAAMQAYDSDAELGVPGVATAPPVASVAKNETVIGASSEVKAPEVVKTTEVLKDPEAKADAPQTAAPAKDDDAENEATAGAKPDLGPVKVTASALRVRSSPTIARDNIVGRLTRHQVVEAVGHQNDWVEIKYHGQTAFIHSSFVASAQDAPAPKTAEAPVAAATT